MKRAKSRKHLPLVIIVLAAVVVFGYFLVPGLAEAIKSGMNKGGDGGGGGTTPTAGQPHSLDFERDLKQLLSITDRAQTGLDLTGDLTFEAWVKLESVEDPSTNPLYTMISKGNDQGGKYSYAWYFNGSSAKDDLNLFLSDDGDTSWSPKNVPYDLQLGVWTHLAVTFDSDTRQINFYADGVRRTPQLGDDGLSYVNSIFETNAPFYVGSLWGKHTFDGNLDDVRVWHTVRTAEEIAANYNKELVGNEPGLVGYWKFNAELVNGRAKDASPYKNHLGLTNKPVFSSDTPF